PGSVVLDMAVEFGGNCEISENGKTVKKYGTTIIGEPNLPSLVPYHASDMYAKNILALLDHMTTKEGKFVVNMEDEIIKGGMIAYDGAVVNSRVAELLK
ncbi:MAG: NAD(P)(+) transhydrogenase (Re/Si-specific) subunit alpha, partial [Ignavibacteria bacterium]|nr:NAD(P)(+) transhydrogenase (Re/Si-specific) subunit alpha [Ignavibacteria bacterium]